MPLTIHCSFIVLLSYVQRAFTRQDGLAADADRRHLGARRRDGHVHVARAPHPGALKSDERRCLLSREHAVAYEITPERAGRAPGSWIFRDPQPWRKHPAIHPGVIGAAFS